MYDVIVIGARCAGSPTARELARRGHRVLLLDRASFPSDTMSTHFIQLPGVLRLARWGLLDRVMATGCPPITSGKLDVDGVAAEAEFPVDGLPGIIAPRRTVLDKILVDAAVEAGAELREGAMVDRVVVEDGRVVGVEGHTPTGHFAERARIVIGADGRNSVVARSVGADFIEHVAPLGAGYYSYWDGVGIAGAEAYFYEGATAVAFPTNDGLTTLALIVQMDRYPEMRKDDERNVLSLLDTMGDLGGRLRAGERAHELVAVPGLANFLRTPAGPGWALVGDAAYHKDPTPADGISDAFRGADLLVAALDDYLADGKDEADALDGYARELEEAARPLLPKTIEASSLERPSVERATAFLQLQELHEQEVAAIRAEDGEEVQA